MKQKLYNYFLYILSKRDYTSQELIDKALSRGYSGAIVKTVISELKKLNYINDHRFVETALHTYKGQKGRYWILQKLRKRKVPASIIEQGLEDVDFTPDKQFRKKVMYKYQLTSFVGLDFKIKQKILNYISRQGFDNAYEIITQWEQTNSEEEFM